MNRFFILTLLVVTAAIYLGTASKPSLLDDADASHAIVAREMLHSGDWVVMHMNGIRWLAKAPVHYWLVAASYAVFGDGEWQTRLPLALAVIGLVLMIYTFGRHFFSPLAGFYAGLVMATSVGTFIFTRIMIPEAIYALQFTALFYLFLRAWLEADTAAPGAGETSHITKPDPPPSAVSTPGPAAASAARRQSWQIWGCVALIATALLTRGLIGVIFPVGTITLFILATRSWGRWRELRPVSSSLIFLAIAVPWHWLAMRRAPGFFFYYFISEHFMRALGTRYPPDYDAVPLPLWLVAHLAWFFPWSIFLPLTLFAFRPLKKAVVGVFRSPLVKSRVKIGEEPIAFQAQLLLALWIAIILIFFSALGGSRMEYYSFGAWPAMALMLGLGLARAEHVNSLWARRCQALLAGLGAVLAGILGYAIYASFQVKVDGDISQLLNTHRDDFYRVSMAHLFDLTPRAFALLRGPAAGAAICFFVGFAAAWLLRLRRRPLAANVAVALAMTGFMFSANAAYQRFEPELGSRPLQQLMAPYLRPEDEVVIYGNFDSGSSLAYYSYRQTLIFNGRRNNLEPGSYAPDAPKIFLDDHDFPLLWNSPRRVFLLVPPPYGHEALIRMPARSTYVVGEIGGKTLYVNHALVAGQIPLGQRASGIAQ